MRNTDVNTNPYVTFDLQTSVFSYPVIPGELHLNTRPHRIHVQRIYAHISFPNSLPISIRALVDVKMEMEMEVEMMEMPRFFISLLSTVGDDIFDFFMSEPRGEGYSTEGNVVGWHSHI